MDPKVISSLTETLTRAFGRPCDIEEVNPAHGGANAASHLIARAADGRNYSIKCSTRITGLVGDNNEYLANRLAESLGLRGSSPTRRIAPQPDLGGTFAVRSAVAIQWSSASCIPIASCREAITKMALSFLHQLGCWGTFNAMIGVTDRGEQNIVWDQTSSTLSHVDFEDSFRMSANLQEQIQFARTYAGLDPKAWSQDDSYPTGLCLVRGVREGSELLISQKKSILALMQSENLEPAAINRATEWIDLPADNKITVAKQSVG